MTGERPTFAGAMERDLDREAKQRRQLAATLEMDRRKTDDVDIVALNRLTAADRSFDPVCAAQPALEERGHRAFERQRDPLLVFHQEGCVRSRDAKVVLTGAGID